ETREGRERRLGARLDERGVADERDAFEAARRVAAGVERAAVEGALQAVVAHQPAHHNGLHGPLGEEGEDFRLAVPLRQGVYKEGRLDPALRRGGGGLLRLNELR